MRERADWMNPVDDRILELLADDGAGTPKSLADSIGHNNDYVGVRCRELAAYGLLHRPSRGLYLLTEHGERYLSGDLDASLLTKEQSRQSEEPEASRESGMPADEED